MVLEQKEMDVIKELQTQEKSCVEKYRRYKEQACDMELKNLFEKIEKLEQKHYDTLGKVLEGEVPECNCNDDDGKDYEPPVTYTQADNSEDKRQTVFSDRLYWNRKDGFVRIQFKSIPICKCCA